MLDVAIVLGSGLAGGVRERIAGGEISYEKLHAPVLPLAGHPGVAFVGTWAGKRVAAFAGRAHLYQGYSVDAVTYFVRLAAASGAKTVVLTNAAGGLNPAFTRGDVMLIADHINLTGESAVERSRSDPFLNMTDAYTPHLRVLAREHAGALVLREGVYAGVRGPQYETPAESEALRRLGADAVGMSTVLEAMMARSLGLDVLGISLIANVLGPLSDLSHEDVLAASQSGGAAVAALVEGLLGAL
jgi:purine-nucleoside phosphorylase